MDKNIINNEITQKYTSPSGATSEKKQSGGVGNHFKDEEYAEVCTTIMKGIQGRGTGIVKSPEV